MIRNTTVDEPTYHKSRTIEDVKRQFVHLFMETQTDAKQRTYRSRCLDTDHEVWMEDKFYEFMFGTGGGV